MQALDQLEKIVSLEPLADKWQAFGWEVRSLPGHDIPLLLEALESVPLARGKPSLIIANTVKGKGISFMENVPIWHYRLPDADQMQTAHRELA